MLSAGRVTQQTASWVREQAAYFSGMYACAYGFPLVMMDVTRQVMTATPELWGVQRAVNQSTVSAASSTRTSRTSCASAGTRCGRPRS
jgi:hypothetical protein